MAAALSVDPRHRDWLADLSVVRPTDRLMPSQLPLWLSAAVRMLHPRERATVFATREEGRLSGLAPFVKERGIGAPFAVAGAMVHFEPNDLFYADEDALHALCDRIAASGRPFRFDRVPVTSPTIDALRRAFRGRGLVFVRPSAPSPWLSLDGGDPLREMSRRRRRDLRRAERRAKELGGFSSQVIAPSTDEVPELFDRALAVEAASWKGDEGTALAHDALRSPFFRAVAEASAARGYLRFCFGRIGETVCAMQIALRLGDGFWLLKIGYDAEFARCSPGHLLMHDSILHAQESGATAYEFFGLVAPWTSMWTGDVREYVTVHAYPRSAHGLVGIGRAVVAKGRGLLRRLAAE